MPEQADDAAGGAGGGASSSPASSSSGASCFGVLLANSCGVCLENKCCAELAACRIEEECIACLSDEERACETNAERTALRDCEAQSCGDKCLAAFGDACTKDIECASQICLAEGLCSKTCAGAADCPPGPEWQCAAGKCACEASGAETCNGADEDCNGQVDDGATCGAKEDCIDGECTCLFTLCSGECVDLATDESHCSGCGLACGAGQLCCQSSCVDAQNDPFDCGACGHDCLGGACEQGKCSPVALNATGFMVGAAAMAVDGFGVFVADKDWLWRTSIDGGFLEQLAEWQASFPRSMAVDDFAVYTTFASPGSIQLAPKFGGFPSAFQTGASLECVVVDFEAVYFTDYGAGLVKRAPLAGGPAITLASEGAQKARACALAGAYLVYSTGLALKRVPIDGGIKNTLVNQPAFDVAVGISHIVYNGTTGLYRVGKNGGAAFKLTDAPGATKVAVDDEHAYWIDAHDVKRVPLQGSGDVETIASAPGTLRAVAVDLTHVYWLDGDEGVVSKVAK